MANILNSIIANQSIAPMPKDKIPAVTLDASGNVKPMEDKGTLLPSRIFGSPIEYVKDLKKDVINITRAAKGSANDHELGRINDLAMKAGSLALASYLFVKNPLKMSKAMEFVGFGTFFGSMALWPKLAIQLPIKLRTGVDVHQKYIDSQDRKKMLFQDPQYDLTDLYSREDLDLMGRKLKVDENLPDRDNFIKQRAKKTATQANTLWMMSAFSAPIMSALACNTLEKPIQKAIEQYDILSTASKMEKDASKGIVTKLKAKSAERAMNKFLADNADNLMDSSLISKIASKIQAVTGTASLKEAIEAELSALKTEVKIDETFVRKALSDIIPENVFATLTGAERESLNNAMESGQFDQIAKILRPYIPKKKRNLNIAGVLESARNKAGIPKISEVAARIKDIHSTMLGFSAEERVLDNYITARVGDKAGTHIANQWSRVGNKLVKVLKLSTKELKALSEGNMSVLTEKLSQLASNEAEYNKALQELMELINVYEETTGQTFVAKTEQKAKSVCVSASSKFREKGFTKIAEKLANATSTGTVENIKNTNTSERILGAQSSFYRLIQSLDIFKRAQNQTLAQQIKGLMPNADKAGIERLVEACKSVCLTATTTDYVEKLKSAGFELSENEYKVVMSVLFDDKTEALSSIGKSLGETVGLRKSESMLQGFKKYKTDFIHDVADWKNSVTKELSKRTLSAGGTSSQDAIRRNSLAGKPINEMIKDYASQAYNSRKWLKTFGIAMAVITAATLVIGLTFGKKTKIEKKVEEESKVNG